jgi:redox-sensitive bicupin YhaK (pirin superfamily)
MTIATAAKARAIIHRTRGRGQGHVTRLMSPSDLGELLKPFVFLDFFSYRAATDDPGFPMHPHSGIATVTFMIEGDLRYEDTTGQSGVLQSGGVEWMRAGNGVWHNGGPIPESAVLGYQLWLALPASQENAPPETIYLPPSSIPEDGPVRVLLGRHGPALSPLKAPASINYLSVHLKNGESWRYEPPVGHTVAWVAVYAGRLEAGAGAGAAIHSGELVIFDESGDEIEFLAHGDTSFVLGSAVKHPHELVMGYYSVHTNDASLRRGEAEIQRIGQILKREGRLA